MKYIIPLPKFSPTGPAQLLKVLLGTGPPESIHSTTIDIKSTSAIAFSCMTFNPNDKNHGSRPLGGHPNR